MNLEDTLKATFASRLDPVDLPAGDPASARRTGVRMRVRRRVAAGAAALAVIATGTAGTLVVHDHRADGPSGGAGHWSELPAAPLFPRENAVVAWTGREVVVVGGDRTPCPAMGNCPVSGLRDGAAYDPGTGTWHPIAPPPAAPLSVFGAVVADGRLVIGAGSGWVSYDPVADRWTRIPTRLRMEDQLSASGSSVYALSGSRVVVYDVRTAHWSTLPRDPNLPRLTQRTVTGTPDGPVVTGYTFDTSRAIDTSTPHLAVADVWDGTAWRRLPPSDQLGISWGWTGRRLVDPVPSVEHGYSDGHGGLVSDWGRNVPTGGTLDPVTGTWGRLPAALTGDSGGWHVSAHGGPWFAVAGQVYDDDTGRVTTLPRPDGAPDRSMSGAWADGRLVVFGGLDSASGSLSNRAWIYTP